MFGWILERESNNPFYDIPFKKKMEAINYYKDKYINITVEEMIILYYK